MAEHLSVSLANVTLDDRFNKKTDPKKTKSENHTTTKEGGEKEMELLEIIDGGEKKNNDLDEIDAATLPADKKSDSPLLTSSSNPTMDFSGTINYI